VFSSIARAEAEGFFLDLPSRDQEELLLLLPAGGEQVDAA